MSESETRIADTQGRFAKVVQNGRQLDDVGWTRGRILLSNRRLVLVSEGGGKRDVPLTAITGIGDRYDVSQDIAQVSTYLSLELAEDDVLLVAPQSTESFEHDFFSALLDQEVVLTRHPAVEGGVVQDTEWQKARIKLDETAVNVATADGAFVEVDMEDIGAVDTAYRTVNGEKRAVVEVEHSVGGTSVETYFSGTERHCSFLASLFEEGKEENEAELDLDRAEQQVLMALYSGVSPFEIPDFTGMDIDEVEETYDRLIELNALDEVRKRREVALTTRGRNIASQAINEE